MFDLSQASQKKVLRPHQKRAIDLLRSSIGSGNRRVVMQGPTGFGKTLVASKIIEGALEKDHFVLFTAPAISLIDQTVAAFEAEGISRIGVMQANHPRTDYTQPVQVASVQTLARRMIPGAGVVIVDECHIRSSVIDRLMAERPDVVFVGLSATPWRQGMGKTWQDLVIPCTIGELIEEGYLSQFRAFAPDVPDLSGVRTRAGEYVEGDLEEVMAGKAIVGNIVETWLRHGENRPTLLFGVNRAHAAALCAAFERAGVGAGYCDAFTDIVERKRLERQFRSGEVKVACSVRTLTTGVDWPVSCIIDAAPTKSEMLHVQKIGRGLRVNPGTEDLLILDHAGNSLRLGLVTDIHHDTLDDGEPKPKAETSEKAEKLPKPCSQCEVLFTGLQCPSCGHERKPAVKVAQVDAELREIGKAKEKATRSQKQLFYAMALWLAARRGYSEGWAAHKYRERFGVWPKGLAKIRTEPDQAFLNWEKSQRIAWAKRNEKGAA